MSNIEKSTTAVTTRLNAEQMTELFNKLVIGSDLSGLSEPQRIDYYKLVCERVGLDPYRKPFDLVVLDGKLTMYANKECTAQLTRIHSLRIEIVNKERIGDMYVVTARCTPAGSEGVDDIGAVNLGKKQRKDGGWYDQNGDAIANAMMKAATKAKRRAVLSACGLGMIDAEELDTVANVEHLDPIEIKAIPDDVDRDLIVTWAETLAGASNADELTLATLEIKKAPQAVRDALKEEIGTNAQRLAVKWNKGKFEEVTT